jgi:tRNA-(ms[2]io[6]A)-hydroxylase
VSVELTELRAFLPCRTPDGWLAGVADHLDELLIDHANCEKKAAGTALSMLYRYVDRPELLATLSRLAREELRHFEQVLGHLNRRRIAYRHLTPSRYAGALRGLVRTSEPARLVDTLLVGAVVEARSCERFACLIDVVPDDLAGFYARLLDSEARHFTDYLDLARLYGRDDDVEARTATILTREQELIESPDSVFRFHSGPLQDA